LKNLVNQISENKNVLDCVDINKRRDEKYLREFTDAIEFLSSKHPNIHAVDGSRSKWMVVTTSERIVQQNIVARQRYFEMLENGNLAFMLRYLGKAAPVARCGISQEKVNSNTGKYGEFCPVSFVRDDQLRYGDKSLEYVAEYQGKFYRMLGKLELAEFLSSPEKYANGPDLPVEMPKRIQTDLRNLFPRQLEINGYCPVTLVEGKQG